MVVDGVVLRENKLPVLPVRTGTTGGA
jgi:hypothetical protein